MINLLPNRTRACSQFSHKSITDFEFLRFDSLLVPRENIFPRKKKKTGVQRDRLTNQSSQSIIAKYQSFFAIIVTKNTNS